MALHGRLARRSPQLFSTNSFTPPILSRRNFLTVRISLDAWPKKPLCSLCLQPKRAFTSSANRLITGQEAPSAQAYIESGVIGRKQNLVGVEKVLVIGSGGLSIGQAGEFDYSGELTGPVLRSLKLI